MDSKPVLFTVARVLEAHGLETVLMGDAAAALLGSPVAKIGFDFFFQKTPANLKRLEAVTSELGATLHNPFYPASGLMLLEREDLSLQARFLSTAPGVQSFESLRRRAKLVDLDGCPLLVTDLPDCDVTKRMISKEKLEALKLESERLDCE